MYLYCGMADVAVETGDLTLITALERLWQHLTTCRMYITGGIGSARAIEGFTYDFDLPNDSTCAESCAAVGLIMWNHRMLQITGESRYADLMERVLYNALLVGVSLDGKRYFYNNPLQSSGGYHREEWYECACCPPNIARLLASLNTYIYSWHRTTGLIVNLYIKAKFRVELKQPVNFRLSLRIPGWCHSYHLLVNNNTIEAHLEKGYVVIERTWRTGDCVDLDMKMPIERVIAHPAVWQNTGRIALQRGPLVYCIEDVYHGVMVDRILLPENTPLTDRFAAAFLGGVVLIEGTALKPDPANWEGVLYRPKPIVTKYDIIPIRAVPYYCWDNREPGAMEVWLREK